MYKNQALNRLKRGSLFTELLSVTASYPLKTLQPNNYHEVMGYGMRPNQFQFGQNGVGDRLEKMNKDLHNVAMKKSL